ncbi:MAG TPA: thiamine phosphate synthase [Candidatus Limisoma intestinavium]|uniref:Thiamine phosphate synthase n=1 Tax=Candidatus Limisoma intestinavium TaxID=2840856 RepID=A0A9D1IKB6_9BACT|nr:thiamine phosphate synthase [Candidatus Limisoma intestinavium]
MSFKLIAITREVVEIDESCRICNLIDAGFDYVHIRKPALQKNEMQQFIESIPTRYYNRLKLHDHFDLADKYDLAGIHLNSRNRTAPTGFQKHVSKSCHAIEELRDIDRFEYVFLSPIFDSISKQGYKARFSKNELENSSNLISEKVMALGGVADKHIPYLQKIGFGGCALLGYLPWADDYLSFVQKINSIVNHVK